MIIKEGFNVLMIH